MRTIEHWIGGKPTTGASTRTRAGLEPGHRRAAGRGAAGRRRPTSTPPSQPPRPRSRTWSQSSLSPAHEGAVRLPRAGQRAHRASSPRSITDEHGKVLSDAAGEVQRGLEVVEFACGIPHAAQGRVLRPGLHRRRRLLVPRSRSASCAGITPFNFPAMVPMWMYPVAIACGNTFVLKPSERDPSASQLRRRAVAPRPGCPTASSTSCTATRWPSTRSSTTPDVAAVSFVGSTPIARYIHERGAGERQAGAGARRRQEPRDRAARRRPRLRRRPPRRRRLRLGRRALHGDLRGRRRRAARPTTLVAAGQREGPRRSRSARAATPDSEMGPVVTAAGARPDRRADRHRRGAGRRPRRRRPRAHGRRATRTASSSAPP